MGHAADFQRFLVAAAMKNEGPFILEWVCWYRMLGFDVLIVTNDCTDHSHQLLGALQNAGWVQHADHQIPEGDLPKRAAHRVMRQHPAVANTEWLLICDVDEFLVLHHDDTVADYLKRFEVPPLGIGFHWKCFGTGGQTTWQDTPTHQTFFDAAPTKSPQNTSFKSMFRRPLDFKVFGAHSPRRYSGPWEIANHVWVDNRGKRLGQYDPNENAQKATAPDRVRHDLAQMNHYILRSRESFDLKRGIPSASAGTDRYTDAFFEKFDEGGAFDDSALRFADAFDEMHRQALALPGVKQAHHLCCADYVASLCAVAGTDPQGDARYRHHIAAAQT